MMMSSRWSHLHTTSPRAPGSNATGFAAVALSALLAISTLAVPSARLVQCPQATALCLFIRVYRTTSPRPSAPPRGIPMLMQAQTQLPPSPTATSSMKWGRCVGPHRRRGTAQQQHHQRHLLSDVRLCTSPAPMQVMRPCSQQTGRVPCVNVVTCKAGSPPPKFTAWTTQGSTASQVRSGEHIHLDSVTRNVHPDPFESGSSSDPEPDFGRILTLEFYHVPGQLWHRFNQNKFF